MAFHVYRSPRDEKLFHKVEWRNSEENIITFGRGTNAWSFDVPTCWDSHVLGGRFSSFAIGIVFLVNSNNHSLKAVTTSPLSDGYVVEKVFGKVRPNPVHFHLSYVIPNKALSVATFGLVMALLFSAA